MLVNPESKDVIEAITKSRPNGEALKILQQHSPVFYKFASQMTVEDCAILKPIVANLSVPYQILMEKHPHDTGASREDDDCIREVFPGLGLKYGRGSYQADKKNTALKMCDRTRGSTLTPGIFTLFCAHGNKLKDFLAMLAEYNYCRKKSRLYKHFG